MIEDVLPPGVAWAEASADDASTPLFPDEAAAVVRAVESRRREFATTRACARRALATLGVTPGPIPKGAGGAPLWPDGVVGSLTHCEGYRAAAVARAGDVAALGIDAEPHGPLPDGVLDLVAGPGERAALAALARREPAVAWDRVLFSAKESLFKAWWPLTGAWLDFADAHVTIDLDGGTTTARLAVPGPVVAGRHVAEFPGRWAVRAGLVLTAVSLTRRGGERSLRETAAPFRRSPG